jgi:RNA polymerase sigma-70 factor (ECF subfamily)
VRQYQEVAFRAAYLLTRDADDAQDVTQDAFIRAYDALGRFDTRRPFRPWLLRIVSNTALNRIKAVKRRNAMVERVQTSAHTVHSASSIEANVLRRERSRRVWQAIARLKLEDQRLVVLRYFLELPEAELAQVFGVAGGTIKSRLHRALRKLREQIRIHDPDLLEQEFLSEEDKE